MNELEQADKAYKQSLDVPPSPYIWLMDSDLCDMCNGVLYSWMDECPHCGWSAAFGWPDEEQDMWYDEYGDGDYREYEARP